MGGRLYDRAVAKVIEADEPATWPSALTDAVRHAADRLRGSTEYALDLDLASDEEAAIGVALAGVDLRLYHSTRLLPHEIEQVRSEGLRLLDDALIAEKLAAAVDGGHLTRVEADQLAAEHAPTTPEGHRAGQVCAVLSTWSFTNDVGAVWRLVTSWGGEAIYWAHEHTPLGTRLASIGTPAIVVHTAPAARRGDLYFPPLARALVGAALGLDEVNGDVFLFAPVPPSAVEAVWVPGTPEYDQFSQMPR